ncbi:hypothetical protein D3C76_1362530 [compost metagenome]
MLEGFDAKQPAVRVDGDQQVDGPCVARGLATQQYGISLAGLGRPVTRQQRAVVQRRVFERERLFERLIVVTVGR